MSKIGKKPILVPEGVDVKIENQSVEIKGKEGIITLLVLPFINIDVKDKVISITPSEDKAQAKANWGTMRALLQNAVTGVNSGFTKELEIQGVGYRAIMEGNTLVLSVGYSHPVKFESPEGIKIVVEKNTVKISGFDKAIVGETAAKIRAVRKPEPYLGKGIRYKGEVVKMKAGKKVAGATAA